MPFLVLEPLVLMIGKNGLRFAHEFRCWCFLFWVCQLRSFAICLHCAMSSTWLGRPQSLRWMGEKMLMKRLFNTLTSLYAKNVFGVDAQHLGTSDCSRVPCSCSSLWSLHDFSGVFSTYSPNARSVGKWRVNAVCTFPVRYYYTFWWREVVLGFPRLLFFMTLLTSDQLYADRCNPTFMYMIRCMRLASSLASQLHTISTSRDSCEQHGAVRSVYEFTAGRVLIAWDHCFVIFFLLFLVAECCDVNTLRSLLCLFFPPPKVVIARELRLASWVCFCVFFGRSRSLWFEYQTPKLWFVASASTLCCGRLFLFQVIYSIHWVIRTCSLTQPSGCLCQLKCVKHVA